tara:strand:+ start:760 stop:888 length:129 start_codon:yes stop_codon:yes gene_type:complete
MIIIAAGIKTAYSKPDYSGASGGKRSLQGNSEEQAAQEKFTS